MKTEEQIHARIQEIINAFAEIPRMESWDLEIEAITSSNMKLTGDIKIVVKGPVSYCGPNKEPAREVFEKTIKYTDYLDTVSDTFSYPEWIGRQSKPFDADKVRTAYKDEWGNLIVEHMDGSTEKFKIKTQHHDEIMNKLEHNLGSKLKI